MSAVFSSLPQAQQDAILDPKGSNKHSAKDSIQPCDSSSVNAEPAEDQGMQKGNTSTLAHGDAVGGFNSRLRSLLMGGCSPEMLLRGVDRRKSLIQKELQKY